MLDSMNVPSIRKTVMPGIDFDKKVALGAYYDSGWVADSNSANHVVSFAHNFGTPPRIHQIFFGPGADISVVYPLTWSWAAPSSANPVTIELTTQSINLNIYSGVPLHGVWDGSSAQWRYYANGFWRVVAWA
jgi:hypothetical protein